MSTMIKICFEANSPNQLRIDLLNFVEGMKVSQGSNAGVPSTTPPKTKNPRKRKSKKETDLNLNGGGSEIGPEIPPENDPVEEPEVEEGFKPPNLTEVRQALQTVIGAKDMNVGRTILGKFNVAKAAELLPDQYNSFISACADACK